MNTHINKANREPCQIEVFDHIPLGCKLELLNSTAHDPYYRLGEFAVVDLTDREFADGEVFLIKYPISGRRDVRQVEMRPYRNSGGAYDGIYLHPMQRCTILPDGDLDWSKPIHLSDGPLTPIYWPEYVMGRVIGIYQAPETLRMPDLLANIRLGGL